jgi:hypothetical protein
MQDKIVPVQQVGTNDVIKRRMLHKDNRGKEIPYKRKEGKTRNHNVVLHKDHRP